MIKQTIAILLLTTSLANADAGQSVATGVGAVTGAGLTAAAIGTTKALLTGAAGWSTAIVLTGPVGVAAVVGAGVVGTGAYYAYEYLTEDDNND